MDILQLDYIQLSWNLFSWTGFKLSTRCFKGHSTWSQSYDRELQRQLYKILQRHVRFENKKNIFYIIRKNVLVSYNAGAVVVIF
jgi:hypothetical protein